jgi:protein TonB
MFALIESGHARGGRDAWTGRTLSLAIHAAIVTAALVATRQVAQLTGPGIIVDTSVHWVPPPAPPPARRCPCPPPPILFPGVNPMSDPAVPPDLPPVQAPPAWDPRAPADPGAPPLGIPPGSPLSSGPALEPRLVDEPPVMLSHPEPRYPEILRQAGLEGRVVLEAVIDTAGRAEPGAVSVVSASNPLFGDAARQVVLGARFRPGRVAGRAVRVRVRIPVTFDIGR